MTTAELLVQPCGEMSLKIREELREPDAEAIERDMAIIREWLEKQPHLPKDIGMRMFFYKLINRFMFYFYN